MSVARGFPNAGHFYSNIVKPIKIDLNFVVDSMNGNGLGLRSLKSNGYVQSVVMNAPSVPVGTPAFGVARSYAVLGASAISNTGSSALTGNLGLTPGSSVTGFPPGTFSGVENIDNPAAVAAKAAAQAAYTDLHGRASTVIATALDGQTLTPGVYSSAGGTFTLAQSGSGTLVLNGAGVYVFQTASTLTTGAGGIPTITLSGGASAANVYWVVGSSATINSGSAGVFQGNIIAQANITDTLGGTVNGSLVALTGAVTFSAASIVNVQPLSSGLSPAPGFALITFKQNFNYYLGGFSGFVSPLSGSSLAVNGSNLVVGNAYVIVSVGSTSIAQWNALGLPMGFVPAVGQSFIAAATGSGGSGFVQAPSVSGINSVEVVGDPNQQINNSNIAANFGARLLVQFLSNSVLAAPVDGSVVGMSAFFDGSSVTVDGL